MKKVQCRDMPDWAPDNAGEILFQDGKWVLVRDYIHATREETVCAVHMCNDNKGQRRAVTAVLTGGKCSVCKGKPPEEFQGFYDMARWKK